MKHPFMQSLSKREEICVIDIGYWEEKEKINNVLKQCRNKECRKSQFKPIEQMMPPLPKERMDLECFYAVSIDCLGPLEMKLYSICHHASLWGKCVKQEKKNDKAAKECKFKKVFVILFGDMVSRAVHLELLQDKTTESVLMAFQRMTSTRSTPRYILSDNAAEFVRANKELKQVMELITSEEVRRKLNEKAIKWFFTPAFSPQHNGLTEILIKGAKNSLYKIFKGQRFTETELTTALKQAEGGLNSRPLLAISDAAEDSNLLTLTPGHLLFGRSIIQLPSTFDELDLNKLKKVSVTTRWEQRKKLQRKFFLRWQTEYLDNLRKRTKQYVGNNTLKEGDVVLLLNEKKKRLNWPIARIEELHAGRDGISRAALLRLPSECKPVSKNKGKRNNIEKITPPRFARRGVEQIVLYQPFWQGWKIKNYDKWR